MDRISAPHLKPDTALPSANSQIRRERQQPLSSTAVPATHSSEIREDLKGSVGVGMDEHRSQDPANLATPATPGASSPVQRQLTAAQHEKAANSSSFHAPPLPTTPSAPDRRHGVPVVSLNKIPFTFRDLRVGLRALAGIKFNRGTGKLVYMDRDAARVPQSTVIIVPSGSASVENPIKAFYGTQRNLSSKIDFSRVSRAQDLEVEAVGRVTVFTKSRFTGPLNDFLEQSARRLRREVRERKGVPTYLTESAHEQKAQMWRDTHTSKQAKAKIFRWFPNLQPIQVCSEYRWSYTHIGQRSPQRIEEITNRTPSHFFVELSNPKSAIFRRFFAAHGKKDVRPKFTIIELITLALLSYDGVADEHEIELRLLEWFPYLRNTFEDLQGVLTLRDHIDIALTRNSISNDRIFEPMNAANRKRGIAYEQEYCGRVWRLPPGNENLVFEESYDAASAPFWRPSGPLQGRKLLKLPIELLMCIAEFCVPSSKTLKVTINNQDKVCAAPSPSPSWALPKTQTINTAQRTDIKSDRHRVQEIGVNWILSLGQIPVIGLHCLAKFLKTNHFVMGPYLDGSIRDRCLPNEWLRQIGEEAWFFLGDIEVYINANPKASYLYGTKIVTFFRRLGKSAHLRRLHLHVDVSSLNDEQKRDFRNLPVFKILSEFRNIDQIVIEFSTPLPDAESCLTGLMTSKRRNAFKDPRPLVPAIAAKPVKEQTIRDWPQWKYENYLRACGHDPEKYAKKEGSKMIRKYMFEMYKDAQGGGFLVGDDSKTTLSLPGKRKCSSASDNDGPSRKKRSGA